MEKKIKIYFIGKGLIYEKDNLDEGAVLEAGDVTAGLPDSKNGKCFRSNLSSMASSAISFKMGVHRDIW